MTKIQHLVLPKTELGNDTNDNRKNPDYLEQAKPKTLNWMDDFTMSEEEINEIADPEWVYKNLIIQGHLIAIPAEPNAGKTTLFLWIASQISRNFEVVYVNADVSGGDAKAMHQMAKQTGFMLLLPDMKAGKSMDDVVHHLEEMNAQGGDYSGKVFIFDTFKKMCDVINKSSSRQLLRTLRGLSTKGMTVILLAHTNKHKGEDGKQIFEGTGDVRSDVDEMIYLVPDKRPDGSMTISTVPDKTRGKFQPITFDVTRDRNVSQREDYVDTAAEKAKRQQRAKDGELIQSVKDAIGAGNEKQKDIVAYCRDLGHSNRRVREVLARYSSGDAIYWYASRGEKNAWLYTLRCSG